MKPLFVLFAIFIAIPASAQDVGSAAAYSAMLEMQRHAAEAGVTWRESKKITLLQTEPKLPVPEQHESMDLENLENGRIGKLSYWSFKVLDVIDKTNVVLVSTGGRRIWLEGYITSDLVDDQAVRIIDYLQVIEPKTYRTVRGSEDTIRAVKMLPKDESEKRIRQDIEAQAENAKYRDWKSKNGKTVSGKLVLFRSSKVTIEQRDGKKIVFPISALIDSHQKDVFAINEEQRNSKTAKKSP